MRNELQYRRFRAKCVKKNAPPWLILASKCHFSTRDRALRAAFRASDTSCAACSADGVDRQMVAARCCYRPHRLLCGAMSVANSKHWKTAFSSVNVDIFTLLRDWTGSTKQDAPMQKNGCGQHTIRLSKIGFWAKGW